jgi:hypothetical protein
MRHLMNSKIVACLKMSKRLKSLINALFNLIQV